MSSYRDDANQFRKEAKWTFWRFLSLGISIVVVLFFIGFGLHSCGIIGKTVVEREVFENSFQYSEARKSEILTFEAQLTEIDRQLTNPELDATTRTNLKAQKSAINIQLQVARNK